MELEPQAARLLNRRREWPSERQRLEHDEQRSGPSGERGQAAEPVPHPLPRDSRVAPVRQVHDEQVDGPRREQGSRHRERLVEVPRREDDEPLRAHATSDRLHRIERAGEVQPGDDRAGGLCLRGEPERERRLARAHAPSQRDGRGPGKPARGEDRVQRREAGRDRPLVGLGSVPAPRRGGRERGGCGKPRGDCVRAVLAGHLQRLEGLDRPRECAFRAEPQLAAPPRSCAAPARLERRERLGNGGRAAHRTSDNRTDVLRGQGVSLILRTRAGGGSPGVPRSEERPTWNADRSNWR
jgi:hypothetical protein